MRKTSMLVASSVALLTVAGLAQAQSSNRTLTANLTGEAEFPGPGDPDGGGIARVTLELDRNQVCYNIRVRKIDSATMAHIHEGVEGAAGPVRVGLSPPSGGFSSGCLPISRELALEILADPAEYYVNVHNPAFPGGAVRGQLGN